MVIVGLTGSIGMGKSAVAAVFRSRGIAVFDADAEVHRLYEGEAVPLIEEAFPGTTKEGRVDRALLAAKLAANPEDFARLESIVHPLVRNAEASFLKEEYRRGSKIAVLEIPLLYETGLDAKVDKTLVVSAPPEIQRRRVLERSGVTEDRLDMILSKQLPDGEKRARADFVVDTGTTLEATAAAIDHIIADLESESGTAYGRYWQD